MADSPRTSSKATPGSSCSRASGGVSLLCIGLPPRECVKRPPFRKRGSTLTFSLTCTPRLTGGIMWNIAGLSRLTLLAALAFIPDAGASDWPQFRGPNCSGLPAVDARLPDQLGPSTNVIWKTALPPGHSSPVVVGDRIYLTAVRDKKLVTLALDRKDGRILWERDAPAAKLEKVHRIGSHAQATPAAISQRVVSFFGS